jgi:hypothetical protein
MSIYWTGLRRGPFGRVLKSGVGRAGTGAWRGSWREFPQLVKVGFSTLVKVGCKKAFSELSVVVLGDAGGSGTEAAVASKR